MDRERTPGNRTLGPGLSGVEGAVVIVALLLLSAPARAGWQFERAFGSEGHRFLIWPTAGTGRTTGTSWASMADGLMALAIDEGLLRRIGGAPGDPDGVALPVAACSSNNRIWVADGLESTISEFFDLGGFLGRVPVPAQDPSRSLLIRDMSLFLGGFVLAAYDFAAHHAAVLLVNAEGRVLVEMEPAADSPGDWDWIWAVIPRGDDLLVYAYDSAIRHSWVEQRRPDGSLVRTLLDRPDHNAGPLWYASRDLWAVAGKNFFFALAPGPDGEGDSLVKLASDGTVLAEHENLQDEVAEPYLRLEQFDRHQCLWGAWPNASEPGHVYLFSDGAGITQVYAGTPGPTGSLLRPQGLAVLPDDKVVVSDTDNYRCVLLTATGTQLAVCQLPGRPGPLLALPDGRLVAVNLDQANNPGHGGLFVLGPALDLLDEWGAWGSGAGQLSGPTDVALGADGNIYVADAGNNRVALFTSAGTFITAWGSPRDAVWPLYNPEALAVGDGQVFVAQAASPTTSRLLAFDLAGNILRSWLVADRVLALAVTGDHRVLAATACGHLLEFDELGAALGSSIISGDGASLAMPGDLQVFGDELYLADTGNSRLVVARSAGPHAKVTDAGPLLLPARDGVQITILGTDLPQDLSLWMQSGEDRCDAQVQWHDPGLAVGTFATRGLAAGDWDLWASGTALPAGKLAQVRLSRDMAMDLAGAWRLVRSGLPGSLQDTDGRTQWTIELDGQALWQRLDGTGALRRGWLAAEGGTVTVVYTEGEAGARPGTESYSFSLSGRELHLVSLGPRDAGREYVFERTGAGSLLEPEVSGVWRLAWIDAGAGKQAVDWEERLTVDLTGAWVRYSNRPGESSVRLGHMEAHDGVFALAEQSWRGEGEEGLSTGTFVVSGMELELLQQSPGAEHTWWQREKQPGRRPLPWVRIGFDGNLLRGLTRTARVYVGNHGSVAAEHVRVTFAAPWLAGGAPQQVALIQELDPAATTTVSVNLTPPASYAPDTALLQATVCSEAPEEDSCSVQREVPVAAASLDLAVAVACGGVTLVGGDFPVTVTIFCRGPSPRDVLSPELADEPALALRPPPSTTLDGAGGVWDPAEHILWYPWSALMDASPETPVVLQPWLRVPGTVAVGTRLVGHVYLQVPAGVEELTPRDNVSGWLTEVTGDLPPVHLALQPPFGLRAGSLVTACVLVHNSEAYYHPYRGAVIAFPEGVDLAGAPEAASAERDLVYRRVLFHRSSKLPPWRSALEFFAVPLRDDLPDGRPLVFRAGGYLEPEGYFPSNTVILNTGRRVGDLDGDGLVNLADLHLFVQGYRAALAGHYDPLYDLAPLAGAWPEVTSIPDGKVDAADACAMVEAYLQGDR